MMASSAVFSKLDFSRECREKYHIGLWQCPQFLFIIMGAVTAISMIATYIIGTLYAEPEVVVFIVMAVTVILFSIGNVVVSNFEQIAQVNRTKSEFIGIVSHQLRAPLTSMKWALGLLLSGRLEHLEEKTVEHLKILREGNNEMLHLVNDLLDANRIEMGEMGFERESIDLKQLSRETIQGFIALAAASNVTTKLDAAAETFRVEGDREKLKMVITNFLDNAIKYSVGKGGVTLEIRELNDKIMLSVKDEGMGIPKDQQKNVFKKFFRAVNAKQHQTHGTGLGLFISKSIVEALGGEIGFSSSEEKGSTFWFTLSKAHNK